MLGGHTSTLQLTCLSLALFFLTLSFALSQSLSLFLRATHTHTPTLVTIKQVVLSSRLSPCLFPGTIYEVSQLFLTPELQLTPHTHAHVDARARTHTQRRPHIVFTFSGSFSLRLPFHHQLAAQSNPRS